MLLQRQGVLPGGTAGGGGGQLSHSNSRASGPDTPREAVGGALFESGSDMEEQSAALVLTEGDAELTT